MPKRKRGVYETISSSPNMLVNIPHHVVVDQILEKLPVKSLLRFRAVSKQWRTEIESPRFQERHLRHQQKSRDPSILICHPRLEKRGKASSLRSLSVGATLVSEENHIRYPVASKREINVRTTRSCDGLACLYSSTFIYVINPATRWHCKLPEARFQTLAQLTYNRFRRPFPVKTISQGYGQINTCEVFSFENNNNTWSHDVIVSCPYPILHDKVPAHAHGFLYWFIDAVTGTQVLSFHLHTETFDVMAKIPVAYAPHHRITMCTLNDRLCLSEDKGDTQTIWSLNQDNVTWDKTYSINLRSTLNCIEEKYLYSMPPVASLFDDRLLLYDCSDDDAKLVVYNFRLNSYGKFFTEPRYYLGSAVPYFQSLFTLR
ncbi:hypothetical protein Bca101_046898 [Brassica carinata]